VEEKKYSTTTKTHKLFEGREIFLIASQDHQPRSPNKRRREPKKKKKKNDSLWKENFMLKSVKKEKEKKRKKNLNAEHQPSFFGRVLGQLLSRLLGVLCFSFVLLSLHFF